MQISLISKKIIFCHPCYSITGKHLPYVCSSVELLVQDSGSTLKLLFDERDEDMPPHIRMIMADLKQRLQLLYGDRLVKMVLYGSGAGSIMLIEPEDSVGRITRPGAN
jgi:hypothetical protein